MFAPSVVCSVHFGVFVILGGCCSKDFSFIGCVEYALGYKRRFVVEDCDATFHCVCIDPVISCLC